MKIVSLVRTRNEEEILPVYLANRHYSDLIVVADDHSGDGTCDIARDHERVQLVHYREKPYLNKDGLWRGFGWKHWAFALSHVPDDTDWVEISDADEVPSIWTQEHLRDELHRQLQMGCPGLAIPFFYVAPGCSEYYVGPSRYNKMWFWRGNRLPIPIAPDPVGRPCEAGMGRPDEWQELHSPFLLLHLNWGYWDRFMAKLPAYEELYGHKYVPLDTMYPERVPLPPDAQWHCGSREMIGLQDNGREESKT